MSNTNPIRLLNGVVYQLTDEEVIQLNLSQEVLLSEAQQLSFLEMRNQRNILLLNSDWTQLPVNPLTAEQKVLWETYRQQLRELPDNTTDIDNVVWPTPP